MKKFNFDILAKRKNTNSVKYDEYPYELPMWVADMDFVIAPKIKGALQKDLDVGSIGYTLIPKEFFSSIVNFYKDRYHTDFIEEEMVYVSGVVAAIDGIFNELLDKGDNVVMLSPIYHTFYSCIKGHGLNALTSEFIYEDGKYSIDFVDLENKLKEDKSKILLLCNPHNPIGKIFNEDELKRIDELANKHHVLVISDEIHGLLTDPGKKYIPYSNIAKSDNYVICSASSKAFNLAGLHSAFIICKNKELRDRLQNAFYRDDIGEANYFAVNANIAAYRDSVDYLDELNEYIYINKQYFYHYLLDNIPELKPIYSEATYMMWVDISSIYSDSEIFKNDLAKKTGILISPGHQFGPGGERFFRINLATSLDNVKEACLRLKRFVKGE